MISENCFREMFGKSNPRKLCASKIWAYTVVHDCNQESPGAIFNFPLFLCVLMQVLYYLTISKLVRV